MKPKEFLKKLDKERIETAIARAEAATSGEIRVFISRRDLKPGEEVLDRARARFGKLGLTRTRERNGVLLYFMPLAQRFAIMGDSGIDEKCGPDFWKATASQIADQLARDHFTEAVTEAVQRVGATLAQHFPRRPDDTNELSNDVLSD